MDPSGGLNDFKSDKPNMSETKETKELHVPQNAPSGAPPQKQYSESEMAAINKAINQVPKLKTFDIFVIDEGADGKPSRTPMNGVKASSAKELIELYAMCGQKIQIIKEYPVEQVAERKEPSQPQMKVMDFNEKSMQNKILNPEPIDEKLRTAYKEMMTVPVAQPKEAPRFFDIGGVKCKLEDGKMYQAQWVKVDASKYRLIADATNKLVSMNGKHLETLKWVQIEGEEQENA